MPEIKRALADHTGNYPICCHGEGGRTISTAIYDLQEKVLHYAYGNPCQCDFVKYAV